MCVEGLRYLSRAMVSSREPTSRSGYLLPSTSRPPDREYPKVLNPGETAWPLITCRETDRLTGVTYSWLSSHRCVQCQTWLGSVETPSLLPLQIITLPVSWNGAPTAKSDTQRSESSSHIRLFIIHQSLQSVFHHVLTLEAILVEVSRSGHRHTEGRSGWSSQHYAGLRIKPTSCIHVNIICPAHLLLTMEVKRSAHQQVVPPAGGNQPMNVTVFYSDFRLLLWPVCLCYPSLLRSAVATALPKYEPVCSPRRVCWVISLSERLTTNSTEPRASSLLSFGAPVQ